VFDGTPLWRCREWFASEPENLTLSSAWRYKVPGSLHKQGNIGFFGEMGSAFGSFKVPVDTVLNPLKTKQQAKKSPREGGQTIVS
jgi:hypothetical protein